MRFRLVVTCVSVFVAVMLTTVPVALAPQNNGQANASTDNALVVQQMAAMPLAFTENKGQWDERVLFRASASGTTLWFCRDGITYQFTHRVPRSKTAGAEPTAAGVATHGPVDRTEADSIETVVIHAAFAGSNPEVELAGENPLEYRCNYFLGNDPGKWRTDVPNYAAVVYRGVYPGVDLRYEGNGGALNCSYLAALESDLAQVKFRYDGNAAVTETGLGQFRVEAPCGAVLEPLSSGQAGGLAGNAAPVVASTPEASGTASVTLVYSTYLGGGYEDEVHGIAIDRSGNAYVTGWTQSSDFPTLNPYQTDEEGYYADAFVTKLSSFGNSLIYSTYLGGGDDDYGYGIAVDGSGNAYVTGTTYSSDFPTLNPYLTDQGTNDVFVTKLSSTGNSLIYSTYLGGASDDRGYGIAVDVSSNAYVTGCTHSSDFPTQNPYDSSLGEFSYDVFVTKLSPAGNALVYSTYLGGRNNDYGFGIAVDGSGNAYVTGWTLSSNFPTLNPYQTDQGYEDVFVTKLSSSGNSLIYSTYLGGGEDDEGCGIAVDGSGNAYLAGYTASSDFPTLNPYQTYQGGGSDAFVTKFSPSGTLIYSTYLGGGSDDNGYGIAVDGSGNAYVTGSTYSSDFPTLNPYQTYQGGAYYGEDAFVTRLSSSGNSLIYSTYLGGGSNDYGFGIAVDGSGNAYVTGSTRSSNFPTLNPYQSGNQGGYFDKDVFVTKLSADVQDGVADDNELSDIPDHFSLRQNYPNPFNAGTVLPFELRKWSQWTLTIFNVLGQQVRTFDGFEGPGPVRVNWDGTNEDGALLPSGIYFYRVTAGDVAESKKMVLLK